MALTIASRKQSWASGSLETRLPPIKEAATPPRSSSLSPRSSKTTKLRDTENPFRRSLRRSSITSVTSTASDSEMTSPNTSGSPKSRRDSLSQKQRASSINLTKSEEILKKVEKQRRHSVLNVMPDGRKASFCTVGKRVATLLKAKNAFAMLKKKRAKIEDDTEDDEKDFKIEKLPPEPRFASTLSAEAQYAMMKGYEDVVYSNLCRQYPEYRQMLRRNRTPVAGISVKFVKGKYGKMFEATKTSEEMRKFDKDPNNMTVDAVDSVNASGQISTSTPKPDNASMKSPREINSLPFPAMQSTDQSPRATQNDAVDSKIEAHAKLAATKTKTSSEVQKKEKQLVMTYRYQRAMDILDMLREHQGMHSLSPRKKDNRHIEPLKEYNSWSHVWTHEFEPKKTVKNV